MRLSTMYDIETYEMMVDGSPQNVDSGKLNKLYSADDDCAKRINFSDEESIL